MAIEVIEYPGYKSPSKYYITIGNDAPWNNMHIRIPYFLFKSFLSWRNNGR